MSIFADTPEGRRMRKMVEEVASRAPKWASLEAPYFVKPEYIRPMTPTDYKKLAEDALKRATFCRELIERHDRHDADLFTELARAVLDLCDENERLFKLEQDWETEAHRRQHHGDVNFAEYKAENQRLRTALADVPVMCMNLSSLARMLIKKGDYDAEGLTIIIESLRVLLAQATEALEQK